MAMSSRLPSLWSAEPFDDMFRGLMRPLKWDLAAEAPTIKVDVDENDKGYAVRADVPGVRKEDLQVRVDGRQITISAEVKQAHEDKQDGRVLRRERSVGYASRMFMLDHDVDVDKVAATLKEGVLTLDLPKKAGVRSGRIPIA
jgi:HSP20 family protein